jgi:glycosyltransferase involved in cell wall biosynthesis
VPSRAQARAALGLPADALVLTAPGLATAAKRLDVAVRALSRLRAHHPSLILVVAGAVDPGLPLAEWARAAGVADAVRVTGRLDLGDFARHLCAADLVLALRFPTHGEMSGALARALAVGRPVLVTDGTPAAEEFPPGLVVPVSPGPSEEDELVALADHLLRAPALRARIEALARQHAQERLTVATEADRLAGFLGEVAARAGALREAVEATRAEGEGLLGFLSEEVRWAARDLGLGALDLSLRPLLEPLSGGR